METDKSINYAEGMLDRLLERAKGTFWDHLGCEFVSVEQHKVVIKLQAKQHHLNPIGIVHGGVLSTMLDNAMGIASFLARPDDKIVTTNLNVHFVSPMKEGTIFATAEIVHQSRKMITATGSITDENGQLGTVGTGSFRVV